MVVVGIVILGMVVLGTVGVPFLVELVPLYKKNNMDMFPLNIL
jgi:hypothetical protein